VTVLATVDWQTWPVYHTEHLSLCAARCKWGSPSCRPICCSWYLLAKVISLVVHGSLVYVDCRQKTACTTMSDGQWMHSWYLANVTALLFISDTQTRTIGRWARSSESGGMRWSLRKRNSITILPTRFEAVGSLLCVILTSLCSAIYVCGAAYIYPLLLQ